MPRSQRNEDSSTSVPHLQPGANVVYVVSPPLPRMFDFSTLLELTCLGRDALYQLIHSGAFPARRFGLKFYVLEADLRAWQASLPKVEPTEMPTASLHRVQRTEVTR